MYGIIGKIVARDGRREELIEVLLNGTSGMPSCRSYIVSKDMSEKNALWITEVWESKESHELSLSLDSVKAAVALGRPMIEGFGERFEMVPVGGTGWIDIATKPSRGRLDLEGMTTDNS